MLSKFVSTHTYLSLLSMAIAQMFLQRRSRPRVACWMDSQSVSVAQASQSCSNTSHRFSTDATPVLCFSMSLCRSCTETVKSRHAQIISTGTLLTKFSGPPLTVRLVPQLP